jgi:hypothetical protein
MVPVEMQQAGPARARAGRDGRGETSVRTGRRRHEAYPMGAWAIRLRAHDRSCPISALYERLVRARGSLVTRPLVIASAQIGSRPRPLAEQMLGEWPLYGHRTLVVLRNVGNISSGGAVGLGKRRWREGLPGHGSGPASPQPVPCQRGRRVARAAWERHGGGGRGTRPGWGRRVDGDGSRVPGTL